MIKCAGHVIKASPSRFYTIYIAKELCSKVFPVMLVLLLLQKIIYSIYKFVYVYRE